MRTEHIQRRRVEVVISAWLCCCGAVALAALPGCIIATNHNESARGLDKAAQAKPTSPDSIVVGSTTRRDLLLKFGMPTRSWKDDHLMMFSADQVNGGIEIFLLTAGQRIKHGDKWVLLAEFDDRGVLKRWHGDSTTLTAGPERLMRFCDEFEKGS